MVKLRFTSRAKVRDVFIDGSNEQKKIEGGVYYKWIMEGDLSKLEP